MGSRRREGGSSQYFKRRAFQFKRKVQVRNALCRRPAPLPGMVLQLSGRVGIEHHLSLPRILAQLLQERIDLAGGCWHGDLTLPLV